MKKASYINATELLKRKSVITALFKNLFDKIKQEEIRKKTWYFIILLLICCYCSRIFIELNTQSVYYCVNLFKWFTELNTKLYDKEKSHEY